MRKFWGLTVVLCFHFSIVFAQYTNTYKPEKEKINDLIHTKLKVDFNFVAQQLNGEAWITAKPHFYSTNIFTLDAKAMLIDKVTMDSKTLVYEYDNEKLKIELPKVFVKNEEFTVYIKYTARPEKVQQSGSAAITDAKGLYFINPEGLDKHKPTQIWTQGETESSSCWFPTIDSPNQKTSQEIYITVPKRFTTLSNGELINQTENGALRTDYWKFDQKHAPYLFFMGIGEYEIVEDVYKEIPVNYYVEKEYAPYAKAIFGNTPEMMQFFSDLLKVEYPWNKYSQIVGRDYVSGAMENTTAVIHGEGAYQKPGQLIDENTWETTIAHELFHHWFGNLVTTESWSNLTLNESFANYSEYLWLEHKYGKLAANMHLYENNQAYINGQASDKSLVRFDYIDKEDMFDLVSYNKGGTILHMLRNYLGDNAFFEGLHNYLEKYKYQSAEVHQLRLVFEELTGKDLNWFFNQWYYSAGHPKLNISYDYNTLQKTVTVNVKQVQANEFQFPFAIDIFEGAKRTRHNVFVDGRDASFTFPYVYQPKLIQVNADGVVLCEVSENRSLQESLFQLKNAELYKHRRQALEEIVNNQADKEAFNAVVGALNDKSYKIRILALEKIDLINKYAKADAIKKIMDMANNDKKTLVQAAAIGTLAKLTDPGLRTVFLKAFDSESYSVLGKALVGMYYIDKDLAIKKSKGLPDEIKGILATPLTKIFVEEKDKEELPFIAKNVITGMYLSNNDDIKTTYEKAFEMIIKSNNPLAIENLTRDMVEKGKQYKQFNFDKVIIGLMRKIIQEQKKANPPNKIRNIAIVQDALEKLL
jgi:aminopeptidase N